MGIELVKSAVKAITLKFAKYQVIKGRDLLDQLREVAGSVTVFNCMCSEYKDEVIDKLCKIFAIKNDANPRYYQSLHE